MRHRVLVCLTVVMALSLLAAEYIPVWQLDKRLASEEAQIFAADNAQWFGEGAPAANKLELLSVVRGTAEPIAVIAIGHRVQRSSRGDVLAPPCLYVAEVYDTSALLNNCGAYTLLSLGGPGAASLVYFSLVQSLDNGRALVIDYRGDEQLSLRLSDYRRRLYTQPASLLGQVTVDSVKISKDSRHYFVSPGRDGPLFLAVGLQSGDRLAAINGIDLAQPDSLSKVYDGLRNASSLVMTVKRDSRHVVLLLGLRD